jgi:hypothetical protein
MTLTPIGIVLLIAGLIFGGLGIAGRIKAAQLLWPPGSSRPKPRNLIYETRRLYELPDHGQYVLRLQRYGDRLIITGVTLCLVGIVLIL